MTRVNSEINRYFVILNFKQPIVSAKIFAKKKISSKYRQCKIWTEQYLHLKNWVVWIRNLKIFKNLKTSKIVSPSRKNPVYLTTILNIQTLSTAKNVKNMFKYRAGFRSLTLRSPFYTKSLYIFRFKPNSSKALINCHVSNFVMAD